MVRGTPDLGRLPNQHLEILSCIAAHVKIDAVPRPPSRTSLATAAPAPSRRRTRPRAAAACKSAWKKTPGNSAPASATATETVSLTEPGLAPRSTRRQLDHADCRRRTAKASPAMPSSIIAVVEASGIASASHCIVFGLPEKASQRGNAVLKPGTQCRSDEQGDDF